MGIALGGSFVATCSQPNQQSSISSTDSAANPNSNQHQQAKSIGQRLSIIWDRTWEDTVAFYTFVLGCFTALLATVSIVQGIFLFRSDRTARRLADAAKRSADTAIALELPLIRAQIGKGGYSDTTEDGQLKRQVWVDAVYFANLGKTKAFPINLQMGLTVGNELPAVPVYVSERPFSISAMFTENEQEVRLTEFAFDVVPDIYDQLRAKKVRLWFYCNLVYLDFMDGRHEIGFCWRRQEAFGVGRFIRDPTPAYNRKT